MYEQLLSFLQNALRLKRMVRSGWVYSGVPRADVESVADHSFMTTLVSLVIALEEQKNGNEIDIEKIMIMALLHDLSESVSQDVDRRIRKFSPKKFDEFKQELDEKATRYLLDMLPEYFTEKLQDYLNELHNGTSTEAKIVSEADRFEVILQLADYRRLGLPYDSLDEEVENYQFNIVKELASRLLKE
ncbi:MAG: HD domain-containing protein [Candidatus Heimdallarchaeota archaeon]